MGRFYRGFVPLKGLVLQSCITVCSAMTFLMFGYDQGVFGGLIAIPTVLADLKIPDKDANLQGTVVAIFDIGCLVGCAICALFGETMGRRIFIIIGALFIITGAGLQAGAPDWRMMVGGRVVAGIGVGMETSFIPIWVSECARAAYRGALVAVQMSIVLMGLVVSYWFDYGTVKNLTGGIVWRLPLAFQAVFVCITLFTIWALPESPRWLYKKGFHADADDVIARIYNVPIDDIYVKRHREEVLQALEAEKEVTFRLKDIFFDSSKVNTSWRIWVCVIIQFLQQLGGINFIAYYAAYLFINNLGMTQHTATLTAGGLSLVFWGGSLTSIYTVERFGRRPVLLWGAVACSTCMICYTIGLAVFNQASLTMAVVFIFLFDFSFGASWCIVPWMYSPEVTPLHVRHVGTAMAVGMEWLMTFVVVKVGPIGIQNVGWKFYILFCVFNVIQVIFVYFAVKETKGLTLEEIDYVWAKPEYKAELEARLHSVEHEHVQVEKTDPSVHVEREGLE
ncbi:MFS transporter [Exophiala viscosa]|uniref:MFS transporter n=1 Tax=Exophiala viscosa TaxID=2486360 RepID=UPI0021A222DB|nr:MFS transporter [Exophiala viscosa]